MGGKGSDITIPPTPTTKDSTSSMLSMMAMMMKSQADMFKNMQMPQIPQAPTVIYPSDTNWESTIATAAEEADIEMTAADLDRLGRQDTVLTSPLLNEEEAATTQSLLSA